jgi:hypothetical protein
MWVDLWYVFGLRVSRRASAAGLTQLREAEADQRCCKFPKRSGDHREPPDAERLKEEHLDN